MQECLYKKIKRVLINVLLGKIRNTNIEISYAELCFEMGESNYELNIE